MRGDYDALAAGVELRAPRAAEDLLHIQHAQVSKGALLGIIHLGTFDDDGVSGQIHSPRQRGGATQHLQQARTVLIPQDDKSSAVAALFHLQGKNDLGS